MKLKDKNLDGKVAIVTGGASCIRKAVGEIFAENSCKVILVDKNRVRLTHLLQLNLDIEERVKTNSLW